MSDPPGHGEPRGGASTDEISALLARACAVAGLSDRGAKTIRSGENTLLLLPASRIVVRISRAGQALVAARELRAARWLAEVGVDAVRPAADLDHPVVIDGRAVTFWSQLPPHRQATPAEVAQALRRLHALPRPAASPVEPLAPFVRLAERINEADWLADPLRDWLRAHLARLRSEYVRLPAGRPHRVLHGDAWVGNVVVVEDRPVFLDLERCSIGPPEWDLVSTALRHTSFGWITDEEYRQFCAIYGYDVTAWPGFPVLGAIRELRMTCYAIQRGTEVAAGRGEALARLGCLRGEHGERPWPWRPTP